MAADGNEAAMAASDQLLFYGVSFTTIPSPSLTEEHAQKLKEDLERHGAEYVPLNPDTGRVDDIRNISHIVSTTSDFPDYSLALDQFVHVVKPSWVDVCIKKGKMSNPRQFSPDPCLFLSDVTVTFADIPEGDKEAITGGVLAMGGQYSGPLTKLCTHVVALSLDNDKCEVVMRKRLRCAIVLPHWFDDCLKLGRRIAEGPYILPNPAVLSGQNGPMRFQENKDLKGATSPVPGQFPTPTSSPGQTRKLDVFKGRKVMLSADLHIGSHLQKTIEDLVRNGGGDVVANVKEATTYVCHYRDGLEYVLASQAGKDVGNLVWLYHLIAHNAWTSPMRRLLHYPIPRNGIPGFHNFKISLSNYTGEARIYLENLVKATGAEFTKTMKQDNTHLITAHMLSEKCDAAKEWNINIVNHLWLEESYALCRLQSLANSRYTHFPPRTNLGEVVGQTQIDREAVEKYYFSKPPESLREREMLHKQGPVPSTNGVIQPSKPKKVIVPGSSAAAAHLDTTQEDPPPPSENTDEASYRPTPVADKPKRVRSESALRTPAASRFMEGKEGATPSTTSSRGAKERAISKLHDLAPDMALYEKEKKRVGGVVHGGRRVSDTDQPGAGKSGEDREQGRKRRADEREDDENAAATAEDEPRKAKKAKAAKTPIVHRMMLTKYEGWEGKHNKEQSDKNKLRNLGLFLTENPLEVTLLCAPKIVRTRKFVAAIAAAPKVVSTSFLDYCLRHDKMPLPEMHVLTDREAEDRLGFRLSQSLERAAQNKRQLLKGWTIFCTESIGGGWETYRDIITANGGVFQLYKGRTGQTLQKRTMDEGGDAAENRTQDEGDTLYLVSGCNPDEVALWGKFRQMARKADMVPRIARSDWLLSVAMSQYIHWNDKWELKEELVPGRQ